MVNEAAIAEAIDDLNRQLTPNYAATARKYEIDRKTLQRRFLGETTSKSAAHLLAQGHLNQAQEEVLVERINTLSARGLPPTPQFVKNLVQEMTGKVVGDHWVTRFVKRHADKLESIYLTSIDYARRVADNSRHFKHYFERVSSILLSIYLYMSLILRSSKRRFENFEFRPPIYTIWTRRAS